MLHLSHPTPRIDSRHCYLCGSRPDIRRIPELPPLCLDCTLVWASEECRERETAARVGRPVFWWGEA